MHRETRFPSTKESLSYSVHLDRKWRTQSWKHSRHCSHPPMGSLPGESAVDIKTGIPLLAQQNYQRPNHRHHRTPLPSQHCLTVSWQKSQTKNTQQGQGHTSQHWHHTPLTLRMLKSWITRSQLLFWKGVYLMIYKDTKTWSEGPKYFLKLETKLLQHSNRIIPTNKPWLTEFY